MNAPRQNWGMLRVPPHIQLRHASFECDRERPHGTVLLLHGRTEFIEKYDEVISELLGRGFDVVTADWRGQGRSSRPLLDMDKGHIDRFATYLSDMDHIIADVMTPVARGPWVLMAHSMGGHLALRHLHDHPGIFRCAVLTAPMVNIAIPLPTKWVQGIASLYRRLGRDESYAPGTGPYRRASFKDNAWTGDQGRFDRTAALVEQDGQLGLGGPTMSWVHAAIDSCEMVRRPGGPESIETPTLALVGDQDRVVPPGDVAALLGRMPAGRTRILAGARHEPLMESDAIRDELWAAIDAFLATTLDRRHLEVVGTR